MTAGLHPVVKLKGCISRGVGCSKKRMRSVGLIRVGSVLAAPSAQARGSSWRRRLHKPEAPRGAAPPLRRRKCVRRGVLYDVLEP